MKLGLQLGYWGAQPNPFHVMLTQEAEKLGFDSVWTAEARGSDAFSPAVWLGAHTERILGMEEAEGTALIEELIAFATQPRFIYAHKWRQGDILIWDNRCTLHRGTEYDYRHHKRDMRRATINEAGEDRSAIPEGLSLGMVSEPKVAR